MKKKTKDTLSGLMFIAPSYICSIIFMIIPGFISIVLCFSKWNHLAGLRDLEFVGLDNFKKIIGDEWFIVSLNNNVIYMIFGVTIAIAISLVISVMLNNRVFCKNTLRVMYFAPYITNGVAVAYVWMLLFKSKGGPINSFLMFLGMENPPQWLASTDYALPALIIVYIWAAIGYNVIIYLANIQRIPKELYEAARVDGASDIQQFFRITVPLITPSTFFLMMTGFITSFKVFDIVAALTQGGPVNSTSVLGYYVYITAFRYYDMGYAATISWVMFAMIFIITLLQWKGQKHWVNY